jgi:hypothetical protein
VTLIVFETLTELIGRFFLLIVHKSFHSLSFADARERLTGMLALAASMGDYTKILNPKQAFLN